MIEKYYIINLYMSFQSIVLKVAFVIYFIFIISIVLLMFSTQKSINYPPDIGICPDYWGVNKDGSCQYKSNGSFSLGTSASQCKYKDFTTPEYFGPLGNKKKCEWAKACQVEWDGITNMGYC